MTITSTDTSTSSSSEALTPGEMAYFSSRGADTSALDAEIASAGSGEAAGGQNSQTGNSSSNQSEAASDQMAGQDEGSAEDGDEEVVIVGKDGKPRNQNGRFVPHQALHKERERRKSIETELMTTREKMARADERLAVLNEILGADGQQDPAQQQQAPKKIDPVTDPLGALEAALQQIKTLEAEINNSKSQTQERENARAMQSAYQNDAMRYMQEKPEFKDAYQFLISGRHRELEAMGMSDVNERNRFIANEERQIVSQAFQSRRSPSQMIHNLAVARGFQVQAQAQAPQQRQQDAVQRVQQLANAQRQAGASLSGAGGSSGEGLTAAALADMSEEEFASVASRLGKSKLRQLLGG